MSGDFSGNTHTQHTLMKTLLTICALSFASVAMAADKCPVSGKPADSSITSKGKDGKTVAFCCEKCKAKFDAKNK
jgi:YHS domain-containing protein